MGILGLILLLVGLFVVSGGLALALIIIGAVLLAVALFGNSRAYTGNGRYWY